MFATIFIDSCKLCQRIVWLRENNYYGKKNYEAKKNFDWESIKPPCSCIEWIKYVEFICVGNFMVQLEKFILTFICSRTANNNLVTYRCSRCCSSSSSRSNTIKRSHLVAIAILVFVNEPIKCCDNATTAIVSPTLYSLTSSFQSVRIWLNLELVFVFVSGDVSIRTRITNRIAFEYSTGDFLLLWKINKFVRDAMRCGIIKFIFFA